MHCGINVKKHLGSGTYGSVYSFRDTDGTMKALKVISPRIRKTTETKDEAYLQNGISDFIEIDVMRRIKHPNIMHADRIIVPANCEDHSVGIVMKLVLGSVLDLIDSLTPADKVRIIHDILIAIMFLHEHNILHLDINTVNVFIDKDAGKNYRGVLADLGMAMYMDGSGIVESGSLRTNINYVAPEGIAAKHHLTDEYPKDDTSVYFSEWTDVWSFSITCFGILTGKEYLFKSDNESIEEYYKRHMELSDMGRRGNYILNNIDYKLYGEHGLDLVKMLTGGLDPHPTKRMLLKNMLKFKIFDRYRSDENVGETTLPSYYPFIKFDNNYAFSFWNITFKFAETFSNAHSEIIFLAADIYRRALPFAQIDQKEFKLGTERLAVVSYTIAFSIIIDQSLPYTYVSNLVSIDKERLRVMQEAIITAFQGIFYRDYLFHKCRNDDDLIRAFPLILSPQYLEMDINAWMATLPKEIPNPKTIKIGEFMKRVTK